MATAKKLKDDFLTCSICYEVYQQPATLACQHTFCQDCLRKYLDSQEEAVRNKTIPCPTCRQETPVPHPNRPVEEWAGQLKPGLLLTGLMDSIVQGDATCSVSKGQTRQGTDHCSVCKEEGKTTAATNWCSECVASFCNICLQLHSKMPNSKNHKVVPISGDERHQRLKDRSQKMAKFKLKRLRESLAEKICLTDDAIKRYNIQGVKLLKERANLESNIQATIKDAVDTLTKKEEDLIKKVKDQTETEMETLRAMFKKKEKDLQLYQQHAQFLDHALENTAKADLAEMYLSLSSGFDPEVDVGEIEREAMAEKVDVSFVHDGLHKLKEEINKIEVKIEVKVARVYSAVADQSARPVLHEVLDAKVDKKDVCNVRGVVVMQTGGVKATVVIDSSENRLKSFYKRQGQLCSSVFKVSGWPSCVTVIREGEVALSVPYCKGILRIAVSPELKFLSKIPTQKKYLALSVLDESTILARSVESPFIDLVSMNGRILKTYTTLPTIGKNVSNPRCLHVTKQGHILVSDAGLKSVVCLTRSGDIVFVYTPTGETTLNCPYGITSNSTGDIFVADYSKDKVIHLNSSGEFVREILTSRDGLNFPMGVCVDDDQLCVTVAAKGLYKYKFVK